MRFAAGRQDRQEPLRLELEGVGRRDLDVRGLMHAPGLATQGPLSGVVRLGRVIAYRLTVEGDDGVPVQIELTQRLALWPSPMPLSLVEGDLHGPHGRERLRLRFDLRRDLLAALRSLRLNG